MFQICGDMEVFGFPKQIIYKMAYGDEITTFELRASEPVNDEMIWLTTIK